MKYIIAVLCALCHFSQSPLFAAPKKIKVANQYQLLLYYSPTCPYSKKVLNYLDKINKTLPMKNVVGNSEAKAELKSLGGKSQVPCLFINGQALYESSLIIDWLSQHQGYLSSK